MNTSRGGSLFCFGDFSKSKLKRFVDLLIGLGRHGPKLREADIVIMTWHGPFLIDLLVFLFFRKKIIFFEHNVIPHGDKKPRIRDFIRWTLAKQVFVPSLFALSVFNRSCRFKFFRDKVSVFQHPLIDLALPELMDFPRPASTICELAFVVPSNRGRLNCCLWLVVIPTLA